MSNMSYCQFENTAGDLQTCRQTLRALIDGDEPPLSEDELIAARRLASECLKVVVMLVEEGDLGVTSLNLPCADEQIREVVSSLNAMAEAEEEAQP